MYATDSLPGPDDRAVLAHVALLHFIAVDRSLAHKLKLGKIGSEIIGVGNVAKRLGKEFIDRVTENATKSFVHPEQLTFATDVFNSNRRVVESGPEPGLAVACQCKLELAIGKSGLRRQFFGQRTINDATKRLNAQSCEDRVNLYCK
jgi:hypothetical protein